MGNTETNRIGYTPVIQCITMTNEKAIFAAGCFWDVQNAFDKIPGVEKTIAGYTGGHTKNPAYEDVCDGETGHTEAVYIEYDPSKVSYEQLLEVFWSIHDPTTKTGRDKT